MKITHSDVPSEILTEIFKQIPRKSLVTCLVICKSWHYTAKRLLYTTIVTGTRNITKLIQCLEKPFAGDMVKLLEINEYIGLEREEFIKLINACYNLQELQIYNNSTLLEWIKDSNEISLNNLRAINLLGRTSWRLTRENNLFYLVAHKFRNSIETLNIPYALTTTDNSKFKSTLEYLSCFSTLKNLTLINGNMNDVVYFDDLLSTCTSLEILNMQLGHPLFNNNNSHTKTTTTTTTTTYSTLCILDFYLAKFNIEYVQYMIDRFINLKSFTLRINEMMNDWIKDKQDIEDFLKLHYIPFIRKLQYSCLNIKMNGSCSIGDFFSNFTLLDKKARIESYFRIENSRSEMTDICIETQNYYNMSARYTFIKDFSSFDNVELPYMKHLIKYGSNIATLYIHLSNSIRTSIDLKFIASQCQNIEQIIIDITHVQQPREYNWYSLLELYDSLPNVYWSEEEREVESIYCNNLSTVQINGGMITSTLLNNISINLLNVKKLSLMNCNFQLENNIFDMSNLSLNEFELDTCMFYQSNLQSIQIIITTKQSSNYYIFDKKQFEHVSFKQYLNHRKNQENTSFIQLEFIFNSIESMRVFIGKYSQQQVIENIFFWYPDYFSYRSIK